MTLSSRDKPDVGSVDDENKGFIRNVAHVVRARYVFREKDVCLDT